VWTAPFGKGRVVYTTLGHDVKALEPPGVAAVFTRGVEWAATGAVTLRPPREANR
jgi:type 1 glutamine amidotransferase